MKNFLLVVGFAFAASGVQAGPFGLFGRKQSATAQPSAPVQQTAGAGLWTAADAAAHQARLGRMGHFGNPTGGYEGCGFSTISPDAAIRNCCFWGQRTPRDIGVCRGINGWFACVRYH